MAKAQQIAYRNLTTYLSPSSTYYDACIGSLLATEDLYGNPSIEYTAVEQAWYAVGVTNGASEIINCKDSRVENFNKLNAKTNNTYGDGSFTGNNGIVWNYVHCSDASGSANYPINGKSLLLRSTNDGSKLFSNAIEGGIKNFSVKFRKAFKSPAKRQLELYINGELKGASQMIGNSSDEDPAIYCFEVENINVSGSFIMEIRLASTTTNNAQIAIDDICWCPYDASGDASLKSIELSAGVLQPEFNSDTTDYSVNVENNIVDISVTGTLASSSATLIGNVTNKELNVGSNIVNILVTAQNGVTQKNYTVNVIRAPIVVSNDLAPITSDKKAMALRAYPNPAGEEITLQPTVAGSDIYIYNSLGLRVACHKASAEQSRIDIRNLPAGIYLIKLDGETVKVIKR
jgi:hypothetical protein